MVGKLCSSKRQQNALAAAIKEYGALRRTVYAARYLADETYRRRIARQLNKGENVRALRRSLPYAGEGAVRRRHVGGGALRAAPVVGWFAVGAVLLARWSDSRPQFVCLVCRTRCTQVVRSGWIASAVVSALWWSLPGVVAAQLASSVNASSDGEPGSAV